MVVVYMHCSLNEKVKEVFKKPVSQSCLLSKYSMSILIRTYPAAPARFKQYQNTVSVPPLKTFFNEEP